MPFSTPPKKSYVPYKNEEKEEKTPMIRSYEYAKENNK